jgi:hypothetical protein
LSHSHRTSVALLLADLPPIFLLPSV